VNAKPPFSCAPFCRTAGSFAMIFGVCLGVGHAPCSAQTLGEIYRKAQIEDPQYRAARKTMEAVLEKLPQARAGLLPSMSLTGNSGKQSGEASFSEAPFIDRDVNSWGWTAQLTQPLVRWSSWVAYQQAGAQVVQANAQFFQAEQDLILRTAQAYFDVMVARENIRVSTAQLNSVHEQMVLAARSFEVGTGIITDVYEARARRGLALAQRIAAVNELVSKQAEVDKMLGESVPLTTGQLVHSLPSLQEETMAQWVSAAEDRNPQVKIQQAALEVAQKEVSKNSSAHLPTLDLTINRAGSYSSGSMNSPASLPTRVNSQQVGVQLTIPLYAGGGTQSKVRESLILQDKAQDDLLSAKRNASSQVHLAFAGVLNGQAQVEALQVAVEAGENAVEANKIGFKIGTRINPDVLNAEQQLYSSMRDLMKARVEVLTQGLKLKAATGALHEQDLVALDALLQPN
jgi:outer membrane protein